MSIYKLKNGKLIQSIPTGKANIIIGEQKNRLTIVGRAPNTKSKKARVICLCECGNYTVINHQDFKENKVKSCGCLSKEEKAKRFAKTAVDYSTKERNINPFYEYLEPTSMRYNESQIIWKIKCRKCGKIYFEAPNELISEKRSHGNNPCQCQKKFSVGVQKILFILEENHIKYEMEKTFPTCLSPKQNLLPFDFYLLDYNILIEYDGEQHFKVCFGQDEQKLIQQQLYDNIKTEWCLKNNIKLIRIPYTKKVITINDLIEGSNK